MLEGRVLQLGPRGHLLEVVKQQLNVNSQQPTDYHLIPLKISFPSEYLHRLSLDRLPARQRLTVYNADQPVPQRSQYKTK